MVCKTTISEEEYCDNNSEECKEITPPVCKITGVHSDNSLGCKTAEAAQPSICKRMDIVTQYFGEEEDKPKVNLMKMNKDSRVFPKNGNRRSSLFRFVSAKTDDAIKRGSRKNQCQSCSYVTSKKQMHVHTRQHFTKHFCSCGYRGTSYETIIHHQTYKDCSARTTDVYEVDKSSYPRFLRHVGWKSATPFGDCIPTSSRDERHPQMNPLVERRPVKERLGAPRINRLREVRPEIDELVRLEEKAKWHHKEAVRYQAKADSWRRRYQLD